VLGAGAGSFQVGATDAYGNVTATARAVRVSCADANLQLSLDGASWVAAATGVTLSPGAATATVYAQITGGAYRSATLVAADFLGGAARWRGQRHGGAQHRRGRQPGAEPARQRRRGRSLAAQRHRVGRRRAPGQRRPGHQLQQPVADGGLQHDSGDTWGATASVSLVNGGATLLYRDTSAGTSSVNAASALGSPAPAPASWRARRRWSAHRQPEAINKSSGAVPTATLSAFVMDAYGNPCRARRWPSWSSRAGHGHGGGASVTPSTGVGGAASTVFTASTTATSANYIRLTVAGLKPYLLNVEDTTATLLALAPNPATAGVSVPVQFSLRALDAAGITGYSTASVTLGSTGAWSISPPTGCPGPIPP